MNIFGDYFIYYIFVLIVTPTTKVQDMAITGIKYETDSRGIRRFVRIDLKRFGNNELVEDFLDGMEAEKRKGGETISLEEFKEDVEKKLKKHV